MAEENKQQTNQQQAAGNDQTFGGLIDVPADVRKIIEESPIIQMGDGQPNPQQAVEQDGDEYLVRPPQAEAQDQKQSQEQSNAQDQQAQNLPKKVKIGKREMAEEEWEEAYNDRVNRASWTANLTKKSQIAAKVLPNLTDDDINHLLPYALLQKKLPSNLKEAILKETELPKMITVKDTDDIEYEVETAALPKEFIDSIAKNALSKAWPEMQKLKEDYNTLLEEHNILKKTQESFNDRIGEMMVIDVMKAHPDISISVRKGESVKQNLENILASEGAHPEYLQAKKFATISQFASDNGMSFDDAYAAFYGKQHAHNAARQQVKQNQQQDLIRERGTSPVLNYEDELIKRANETGAAVKLRNIGI